MGKNKSLIGTVLKLGGLAAATAAVYYKREEIKSFLDDLAERCAPAAKVVEEEAPAAEPEIVIDVTGKAAECCAECEETEPEA